MAANLKEALWEEATGALANNRDNLLRIREHVESLLEQQRPLREARRAAVVAGDAKEAQRLFEEIRAIGRQIAAINQNAHQQTEMARSMVMEAIAAKEEE